MSEIKLTELLEYVDPALCSYQEWVNVGMALKHEGYTAMDWDSWSKGDHARYHAGECFRKWDSFEGSSTPVTGGTIYQLAVDGGYEPPRSYDDGRGELDWDSTIKYDNDYKIIDKDWVEAKEIKEPDHWNPVAEITKYLEILFDSTENVGYVTETWEKDGKHLPTSGSYDRTAGELIQLLNRCEGDLGRVFGDPKEEAGAWIRFNPLDGKGVKNDNVTDYRYALVESDSTDLAKQNAIIRELELPVACLVYSGGKSVHAIVRVEAKDYNEYRTRVDYLYSVCKKNGLAVDSQNKNPSRLSRMPGVIRNGHKQFLIDTNIGKASWDEWYKHINLELDRASCLHRFKDVYQGLGVAPHNLGNIDIWNLRGKTVPMDKLAPKLIRRAAKKHYTAVIIDPIYKVLTGDENSADQMAHFTNQFDKVATELGASVIYCHHHSKGSQGGKKSMDRASGSGVFARDPDALIDLVELEINESLATQQLDKAKCQIYKESLLELNKRYFEKYVGLDDLESAYQMKEHALKAITTSQYYEVNQRIKAAEREQKQRTAWRVEGTLREFAKFEPVNIWFGYPVHTVDDSGVLNDVEPEDSKPNWQKAIENRKSPDEKKNERKQSFKTAYSVLFDGTTPVTIDDLAEYMGISAKTVRRRAKEAEEYEITGNIVAKKV